MKLDNLNSLIQELYQRYTSFISIILTLTITISCVGYYLTTQTPTDLLNLRNSPLDQLGLTFLQDFYTKVFLLILELFKKILEVQIFYYVFNSFYSLVSWKLGWIKSPLEFFVSDSSRLSNLVSGHYDYKKEGTFLELGFFNRYFFLSVATIYTFYSSGFFNLIFYKLLEDKEFKTEPRYKGLFRIIRKNYEETLSLLGTFKSKLMVKLVGKEKEEIPKTEGFFKELVAELTYDHPLVKFCKNLGLIIWENLYMIVLVLLIQALNLYKIDCLYKALPGLGFNNLADSTPFTRLVKDTLHSIKLLNLRLRQGWAGWALLFTFLIFRFRKSLSNVGMIVDEGESEAQSNLKSNLESLIGYLYVFAFFSPFLYYSLNTMAANTMAGNTMQSFHPKVFLGVSGQSWILFFVFFSPFLKIFFSDPFRKFLFYVFILPFLNRAFSGPLDAQNFYPTPLNEHFGQQIILDSLISSKLSFFDGGLGQRIFLELLPVFLLTMVSFLIFLELYIWVGGLLKINRKIKK